MTVELSCRDGWRAACLGFSTTASRVTSAPVSLNDLILPKRKPPEFVPACGGQVLTIAKPSTHYHQEVPMYYSGIDLHKDNSFITTINDSPQVTNKCNSQSANRHRRSENENQRVAMG